MASPSHLVFLHPPLVPKPISWSAESSNHKFILQPYKPPTEPFPPRSSRKKGHQTRALQRQPTRVFKAETDPRFIPRGEIFRFVLRSSILESVGLLCPDQRISSPSLSHTHGLTKNYPPSGLWGAGRGECGFCAYRPTEQDVGTQRQRMSYCTLHFQTCSTFKVRFMYLYTMQYVYLNTYLCCRYSFGAIVC